MGVDRDLVVVSSSVEAGRSELDVEVNDAAPMVAMMDGIGF